MGWDGLGWEGEDEMGWDGRGGEGKGGERGCGEVCLVRGRCHGEGKSSGKERVTHAEDIVLFKTRQRKS